jgi:hypothetical protein
MQSGFRPEFGLGVVINSKSRFVCMVGASSPTISKQLARRHPENRHSLLPAGARGATERSLYLIDPDQAGAK